MYKLYFSLKDQFEQPLNFTMTTDYEPNQRAIREIIQIAACTPYCRYGDIRLERVEKIA